MIRSSISDDSSDCLVRFAQSDNSPNDKRFVSLNQIDNKDCAKQAINPITAFVNQIGRFCKSDAQKYPMRHIGTKKGRFYPSFSILAYQTNKARKTKLKPLAKSIAKQTFSIFSILFNVFTYFHCESG